MYLYDYVSVLLIYISLFDLIGSTFLYVEFIFGNKFNIGNNFQKVRVLFGYLCEIY